MNPWTLPWHYLSGTVTLIAGWRVGGADLVDRLLNLPDQGFRDALAPDQPGHTQNGLFSHVRAMSQGHTKPGYRWTTPWPAGLTLKLRTGTPLNDVALDLGALILPWPFPGDQPSQELAERLAAIGGAPIPPLSSGEFNPNTGLPLSAFMSAADAAVGPKSGQRRSFARVKQPCTHSSPSATKKWVVDVATARPDGPDSYPGGLVVCVDDSRTTRATEWESDGTRLRLVLGWQVDNTPCPIDEILEDMPDWLKKWIEDLLGMRTIDAWPTGAYCEYD